MKIRVVFTVHLPDSERDHALELFQASNWAELREAIRAEAAEGVRCYMEGNGTENVYIEMH